jgi:hypothetical protein
MVAPRLMSVMIIHDFETVESKQLQVNQGAARSSGDLIISMKMSTPDRIGLHEPPRRRRKIQRRVAWEST